MAKKKAPPLLYPILFILLVIIEVSLLWKYSLLLVCATIATLYLKNKIIPLRKELTWFLVIGFTGAFGESLMMLHGPWSYASPNLLNFPIWLIFVWGLAGCIGVSLYQAIESS